VEDGYWRAVVKRDPAADGRFVTGVITTGIYCRPSCPARRPRRNNVRFFPNPEAAESAGLRACLRCRPREAGALPHVERMAGICRLIDDDPWRRWTLRDLAKASGHSRFHFQKVFRRIVGVTPKAFAESRRLDRLKERLREGDDVTGALFAVGFGSSSRLYEKGAARMGMTPGAFRKGGRGVEIVWTIRRTKLGRLLLACTPRGVCAVSLGGSVRGLRASLERDYPNAVLVRDDAALDGPVRRIEEHLDGKRPSPGLPMDVAATAFQAAVWRALQAIPYGGTATYASIASAIGRPGAARAVGRACASNRAAVLVPCHRAVGADGTMRGYRWGTSMKKALLKAEADGIRRPLRGGSSEAAGSAAGRRPLRVR